jgi:hypothetical protein
MTYDERCAAVASFGFTPRQASFLTTVMLHAGVCLPRQYTAFSGIVFGQKTRDFFERLTRERFATAYPCWRGTGRVFHVHHKGLYRAIGEPDNRHRRPATVARAIERLMVLDAVLSDRQTTWLATEREKVAHFVRYGLGTSDLPRLEFAQRGNRTVRYFPHKLPVGLVSPDQVVLIYVVTEAIGREFRTFLSAHRPLLQRLHRWVIRLALPAALLAGKAPHIAIANEFFAAPLRPGVLDEFRWFCQTRKTVDEAAPNAHPTIDLNRYSAARRAFGAPRFYAAYREWCQRGEPALNELLSPRLHETWTRGDGRLDIHVLPHQYHHLVPAVATA